MAILSDICLEKYEADVFFCVHLKFVSIIEQLVISLLAYNEISYICV